MNLSLPEDQPVFPIAVPCPELPFNPLVETHTLRSWALKFLFLGWGDVALWLRTLAAALARDLGSVPSTQHDNLETDCNSSFRVSISCSGLQAPSMHKIYKYTCSQNTYMHKKKYLRNLFYLVFFQTFYNILGNDELH